MYFISDNAGPAAPEVMAALARANQGYAQPYGEDALTQQVEAEIRTLFEAPEAKVFLVTTGTAANALSLSLLANPWQGIFCHQDAHIAVDECGAPEFFSSGCKLVLLEGPSGKIDPNALATRLALSAAGGVHSVQPGPLSITQATEWGTIYDLDEISRLTKIAKAFGVGCHMDGARFANALVSLGSTPAEMTWKAGIDVLSFGGTKNGLMGVEAVIVFDPAKAWEFELRRKRAGHLVSKNRFLAAQMLAYLNDDLWRQLAGKANAAAARLETAILALPEGRLVHKRQANMVFAGWSRAGHDAAQAAGAQYYLWPNGQAETGDKADILTARLVCNWTTSENDIDGLITAITT